MARVGKGIMLAAGPADVFARVDGALAAMTGDLWYVGDDLRKAAGLKLVGNATLIAITGAIADTLAVGRGLGLSSADVNEVLTRLNPGASIGIRGKRMATGDFTASFELAMARKDVGLMLEAVGDAPLATLRAIAERSDKLIAAGHGADDLGVLALDAVRTT
jgi:3-hydroxyisobutyrate dehydrogenase-like beta-hydroxyacid dehydrogenase